MRLGVYMRDLCPQLHGIPAQAAQKAANHNVDFVAILVSWQSSGSQKLYNESDLVEYCRAFYDAGIDVHLWMYPWHDMEHLAIRTLRRRTDECEGMIRGWILDPELGYKWRGVSERTIRYRAKSLVEDTIDAMDESLDLGITSYGALSGHKRFPWDIFLEYGWLSPQIYNFDKINIKKHLHEWRHQAPSGAQIIPSVAAFKNADVSSWIGDLLEADPDIEGVVVWSWRQISEHEWDIFGRLGAHIAGTKWH